MLMETLADRVIDPCLLSCPLVLETDLYGSERGQVNPWHILYKSSSLSVGGVLRLSSYIAANYPALWWINEIASSSRKSDKRYTCVFTHTRGRKVHGNLTGFLVRRSRSPFAPVNHAELG
ncbi:hypothetical protein WN55_08092 [Dufourea novaeangliae]|uniref:Uncharacterized protein n=1 Tax=Dufourea novaeangliae TaxID=178035 RepID=A0A154P9B9_DUFNO|nr:hypothetical protein WN55_08092 [Dufourea novaeangliae]